MGPKISYFALDGPILSYFSGKSAKLLEIAIFTK